MTELISSGRLRVTLGLVLGFFAAVYPVLPTAGHEVQSEAVRLAVSVAFFSVAIALVLGFVSIGLPFAIGVAPILLVLRSGGAIYGAGVDLFYLVVAIVAWYRLPPSQLGQRVRIRGRPWLLLLAVQCTVQVVLAGVRSGTAARLVLPVEVATFYVVVYLLSTRMSQGTFRLALCALMTGCVTVLIWTLSASGASSLLALRLGYDLGLNPNLIGQFAVLLIFSALLLLVLRQETRLDGFSFLVLPFGVLVVFLSGSRVALIQLGLALLVLFANLRMARTLTMVTPVALVVAQVVGPGVFAEGLRQSEQFGRLVDFQRGQRTDLTQFAWELAAENPVFGVGPGNFVEYSLAAGLTEESGEGSYHHDAIAGTAAELGFVGLGLFALWYLSFLSSRAVGRRFGFFVVVLGTVAMAGGVTHGFFLDFFGALPFLFAVLSERFVEG